MELFSKIFLTLHIAAGFTSIVLFWLPTLSKKGGDFHVKVGKLYVKAMWVVVITAMLLSIKNVIIGQIPPAIFLGFLAIITASPLWYAIAILDLKKGQSESYKRKLFYFNILIASYAIGMIIYGIQFEGSMRILMFIFGGLGLTAIPDIMKYLSKKPSRLTWIQEHLVGMFTTGIAAYTAFFVFGGQNFFRGIFTGYWSILPWVAPGILGTIANFYFSNKYKPKEA